MKNVFLLTLCAGLAVADCAASSGYTQAASQGVVNGVSMKGDVVFGFSGRSGIDSQSTWFFDVDKRTTEQFTTYNENIVNSGGQVNWMNTSGTCVGSLRDDEWLGPEVTDPNSGEVICEHPLYTACLWKNGTLIKLDHNRWEDPATFVGSNGELPNATNGFVAKTISDDETTIAGYLKAFTYILPVRWTRGSDGIYKSEMLQRTKGVFYYLWVGASTDGSRIVMNTAQIGGESHIWEGDEAPREFTYSEAGSNIEEPCLTALSPNGRYAVMNCVRDGDNAFGVYDFDTNTVRWIPRPENATSSNWFAANIVTDRGDGFIVDYNYHLHYFNLDLGINIPFDAYLAAFGSDISYDVDAEVLLKSLVRGVSPDGRTIAGNTLRAALETNGWIVRLPDTQPMLFALADCSAFFSTPDMLTVKWRNPQLPEGACMNYYVVEVNGEKHSFDTVEISEDGVCRVHLAIPQGDYDLTLYGVASDKNGKEWTSVKQALTVEGSSNTSLYFFEDLLDSDVDLEVLAYIYTHDTFMPIAPTDSRTLGFRLDGGDFLNPTPFWYTCGYAPCRWDTYMESRWFDATNESSFYFTWQERNMMINSEKELSNGNALALEYSLDGENWETLNESFGADNNAKWIVRTVDLSQLAGKLFKLRFHAYGDGNHACEWRVDYYGIRPDSEIYDAPEGLMALPQNDGKVALAWKNNLGEYEVSYNYNSPMTYNKNVGNEGKPLYVACDYGKEKLSGFEGKYITAVATMLYEPTTTVEQDYHTTVEAYVFDEKGNVLSKGKLAPDAPWYEEGDDPVMPIQRIVLDNAVKIEYNKKYRVAIKISKYDKEMCPIWYFSASDDFITGVTDLYSDDNLESWGTISGLYMSSDASTFYEYGRCIFNIRPCITDTPEAAEGDYDQLQWFYQVYKNGDLMPQGIAYYTQQSVVDQPEGDTSYTVQSYRRDGSQSRMSESCNFSPSGISPVAGAEEPEIMILNGKDGLYVQGDFDSVALYTIDGVKVSEGKVIPAGVPHGLYVVSATKDGKRASYRFIL